MNDGNQNMFLKNVYNLWRLLLW